MPGGEVGKGRRRHDRVVDPRSRVDDEHGVFEARGKRDVDGTAHDKVDADEWCVGTGR